jgi:hypothetical protein
MHDLNILVFYHRQDEGRNPFTWEDLKSRDLHFVLNDIMKMNNG